MYAIFLCNLERYLQETYSPVILKFIEPRWRVVNVAGTCVSLELDNRVMERGFRVVFLFYHLESR